MALAVPAWGTGSAESEAALAAQRCAARAAAAPPPDFAGVAAREGAAVVRLVAIGGERDWDAGPPDDGTALALRARAWPRPASGPAWNERTAASGFLFAADGRILTNAHAVADADEVWALLDDGRRLRTRVLGWDRPTDVALLQVAGGPFPNLRTGAAPAPCAGDWVAAIGAPFGFARSVTAGVVSANPRYLPGLSVPLIQSDVALNPGSSGGPLLDAAGRVVGMNALVYSATGGYIGVSFSVPIAHALAVAEELRLHGRVRRGRIGVRLQPMTPELAQAFGAPPARGVLVVRVDPGSPAAQAGLRSGDLLLGLDGREAGSAAELQQRVAAARPGQRLLFDVWRRQAALQLAVTAALAPTDRPRGGTPSPAAGDDDEAGRFGLALADRPERAGGLLPAGLYVMAAAGIGRRAGIQAGDRVLAVNDQSVANLAEFDAVLAHRPRGAPAALLIQRAAAMSFVAVGAAGPGLLPDELP